MGKGRWQPGAANRNHAGPQGQQLEPGNGHGLSEPCAVKSRTHGSSGGKGPRGPYLSQLLHPSRDGVEKARQVIEQWLSGIGLELKPSKTRLVHTLEGNAGFDFLGFNVRQYRVGKTHSAHSGTGKPLGFKTLIKPSREAIKAHVADLGKIVRAYRNASQEELIDKLKPVITGWAQYHRTVVSSAVFTQCDTLLYYMLRRWAFRRHPKKPKQWVVHKYWAVDQGEGWKFKAQNGRTLKVHSDTPIRRHTKVQNTASPYDGKLVYWAQRLRDHPLTNTRTGYLLRLRDAAMRPLWTVLP